MFCASKIVLPIFSCKIVSDLLKNTLILAKIWNQFIMLELLVQVIWSAYILAQLSCTPLSLMQCECAYLRLFWDGTFCLNGNSKIYHFCKYFTVRVEMSAHATYLTSTAIQLEKLSKREFKVLEAQNSDFRHWTMQHGLMRKMSNSYFGELLSGSLWIFMTFSPTKWLTPQKNFR